MDCHLIKLSVLFSMTKGNCGNYTCLVRGYETRNKRPFKQLSSIDIFYIFLEPISRDKAMGKCRLGTKQSLNLTQLWKRQEMKLQ